ncbi:MAG TPA: GDSL-type esterase/lipase family protein [Solirubrobacteraceae bacterium]|nr:GDSL-type esterase/lipase family protein [Solirubrobacteraceae bacterium]
MSACRLGVIAFGDSITNGGGELQWGVALQSWALWLARGLGLPYTPHAGDGAVVADVLAVQMPAVGDGSYDLGCLYIGVNDVRGLDWDRAAFERGHEAALAFLAERCDRVLTATVPLDLGRPRAGAKVEEANLAIEASARRTGALVLDLRAFGGRNLLMADHVHPTAFGQIAIAERALDLLAADGIEPRVRPSSLIRYETTRVGRLRGDLTYAYRHAKVSARASVAALRGRSRAG